MSTPPTMPRTVVAAVASTRSPGRQVQDLAERRLARRPEEDRAPQRPKQRELAEQGQVVRRRLAEAEARIDDQPLPRHAGTDGPLDGPLEVGDDLGHQGRVAGLGAVVHEHQRDAVLGGDPGDGIVVGHAPDVVDQVGPGVERRVGHGRLGRVDREGHVRHRRAKGPDHGNDAGDLVGHVDRHVARPRGGTADVEEIGSFVAHPPGQRHCRRHRLVAGREEAVTRERVGRHVQDAHDERAGPPPEPARADRERRRRPRQPRRRPGGHGERGRRRTSSALRVGRHDAALRGQVAAGGARVRRRGGAVGVGHRARSYAGSRSSGSSTSSARAAPTR